MIDPKQAARERAGEHEPATPSRAQNFAKTWSIALRIAPIVAALVGAKAIVDVAGASFIDLTTLFGSVIAANVFVLGFLLAGTLADYKESERLPGELAASIEAIVDECLITLKNKGAREARDAVVYMSELAAILSRWFYKEERTKTLVAKVTGMNEFFRTFESLTQPNFIVRMKQEQNNIRRIILRIDAIRDTEFLPAGYVMSYTGTAALLFGILFANIEPYWEAMFYMAAVGFLMIYLTVLIRDIDNPFDHYMGGGQSAHVSLKSITELGERLSGYAAEVTSAPLSATESRT